MKEIAHTTTTKNKNAQIMKTYLNISQIQSDLMSLQKMWGIEQVRLFFCTTFVGKKQFSVISAAGLPKITLDLSLHSTLLGTSDMVEIHRQLEENAYNVDLAVDSILTENARQAGRNSITYLGPTIYHIISTSIYRRTILIVIRYKFRKDRAKLVIISSFLPSSWSLTLLK